MKYLLLKLAEIFSMTGMLIGATCIYGYIFNMPRLYCWVTGTAPMAFNTGLAFFALGIGASILALLWELHWQHMFPKYNCEEDK